MNIFDQIGSAFASDFVSGPTVNPQYQPQQRDSSATPLTWVGLSLADKEEYLALDFGGNRLDAMDWAEKRLKEKNT
jgi:hypothetical protein